MGDTSSELSQPAPLRPAPGGEVLSDWGGSKAVSNMFTCGGQMESS